MLTVTDGTYLSGGSISLRATNPVRFYHFDIRTSSTVTIASAPVGALVTLRGYGGVVLGSATADGSGNATISNYHFPAWSINIHGIDYVSGLIWGGDTWTF